MTTKSAAIGAVAATAALVGGYAVYAQHQRQQKVLEVALAGAANVDAYRESALLIVVDVGSSSIRASCFALVGAATGRGFQGKKYCDGKSASGHKTRDSAAEGVEWVMLKGSLQQLKMDGIINSHGEADIHRIEKSVETVLDRVMEFVRAIGFSKHVRGVGFSTFAMNILGVDHKGKAVTPVYTYAGRRPSTAGYARQLRETLSNRGCLEEFHNRTGTVIHPAYAPAEFLRLHHEEPALLERVHKWQSISSYLLSKWMLAGDKALPMSFSEASWAGLLDFRQHQWDQPLLDLVHMDKAKMPELQDSSVPISGLRPAYIKRWPELANRPFFLGIGDGAAANIGSKAINSSRIAVTVGTSAALRVVVKDSVMANHKVPKGLWCYRIGKEHVMLGGALNDGGSVFQFFHQTLQLSFDEIDEKLPTLRPAHHGLTVLPFLSGERAPGWHDEATCTIMGINKWTKPVDLLQAGMEAVALRIALVFSLLAEYADSDAAVIASGTALTSSKTWRQMLADCIGRELAMETHATEATSRGVAVFIGTYLGLHSFEDSGKLASNHLVHAKPNVAAHAAYLDARQAQESLYRKLYVD
ncbi:hypothetical protein Poli38472_000408 [Pythium oligandrum]|uniref:Xylulokinase n=1 Tax=Pythium oligandrum TaxID=41045 RepID=A0A8K1CBP2_PYTOL|nr:hypothetical protein Poli38472_000408 [Pythium oligandrum]|eukprot:TMW60366.1 hypothetical protein Poli38472_000408 [Pythium oligandrum]